MKDLGDNNFWILFWLITVSGIVSVTVLMVLYFERNDQRIQDLIEQGIDPEYALCAFYPSTSICTTSIYNRKTKWKK